MPIPLIIRASVCPGDYICLGACLRDLHKCQPGRFLTDMHTAHQEIWAHNPYITKIDASDPTARIIHAEYDMVNRSNQCGQHMISAYHDWFSRKLNCSIKLTEFRGDLHFSPHEVNAEPRVAGDYWVIDSGGKNDFTTKWPIPSVMQAVVDHFAGRLQFVQIGTTAPDVHPKLSGVVDLIGQTTMREVLNLIRMSSGVITPISFPMHASAAIPMGDGSIRPCVVIAGGREPRTWEAYPGHAYLDRVGKLPCCATGACWKNKTGGTAGDSCNETENVMGQAFPKCITSITAQDIIREVETYLSPSAKVPDVPLIQIAATKQKVAHK